ncbi:DUF3072 domain-containing protein [Actinoplanes sp. G11-F43]|uniref:DUF3072 domain-containing protein n=1 Tax=Actinoplanes sp. G11-F43 TaxID=3424130 RepID=UPI003D333C4A
MTDKTDTADQNVATDGRDAADRKGAASRKGTPGVSSAPDEKGAADDAGSGNAIKDPADWVTGDQPATGAQESYLHTLATEADEEVPDGLTKADASRKIDELQEKTGRGV